jgi:hypothetical protein
MLDLFHTCSPLRAIEQKLSVIDAGKGTHLRNYYPDAEILNLLPPPVGPCIPYWGSAARRDRIA